MPTVLITGANRGLGLGLSRLFLNDGYHVIAVNRQHSAALESLPGKLELMQCELTDDRQLTGLARDLGNRTIDVLINNAGRMATGTFTAGGDSVQGFGHFDRAAWQAVFDINLFTPMHLCELLAENLASSENGRIATVSSMLGSMSMNDFGGIYAYRASKAGVNAIMKSMSIDLRKRGITAVALHPGWVRTDMGGSDADLDIDTSVSGLKQVIEGLSLADSGKFISYDGTEMSW